MTARDSNKKKFTSPVSIDRESLTVSLLKLASLRREAVSAMELRAAVAEGDFSQTPERLLRAIAQRMNWESPVFRKALDETMLPCLVVAQDGRIGVVTSRNMLQEWMIHWSGQSNESLDAMAADALSRHVFVKLRFSKPFSPFRSPSLKLVAASLASQKIRFADILLSTLCITVLAFVASFYSMQVYDRVVPTHAMSTLLVLTIGAAGAAVMELLGKAIRSTQLQRLTDHVDAELARGVLGRFLQVRLDQLPTSVGATASRLRSYETIRGFLVALSTHAAIDIPLAAVTLFVMYLVGGYLVLVPLLFASVGVLIALGSSKRWGALAKSLSAKQHMKTGLLVECIEGAEVIKSGQGGWRFLARWMDITEDARSGDAKIKHLSDTTNYALQFFQQLSYIGVIAWGASIVGTDGFTMGMLIACSILNGRALAPISVLPTLVLQWASTKAAIQDLDAFFKLEVDYPPGTMPIVLDRVRGDFSLSGVTVEYAGATALNLHELTIRQGERIAVVGGIGSGKTSLLRILSGMYQPKSGRILLSGITMGELSKDSLCSSIGYVPQDGRLFAGTLRDNLLLGLQDPGDDTLLDACRRTGLLEAVIQPHPRGMNREIHEGGIGLSGGQRQLVHFTRALLRKPTIWLLDEPTASMDSDIEKRVLAVLGEELSSRPESTLILVTHKQQLLALTQRLIVLSGSRIVADGPTSAVMKSLCATA